MDKRRALRVWIGVSAMEMIAFGHDRVQRHVDVQHAVRNRLLDDLVYVLIVNEQQLPLVDTLGDHGGGVLVCGLWFGDACG